MLLPRNIDVILHDSVRHSHSQVEDAVFVRFDRFGGVDDEHQRRVEHLVAVLAQTVGLGPGLRTVLTFAAHTPSDKCINVTVCTV